MHDTPASHALGLPGNRSAASGDPMLEARCAVPESPRVLVRRPALAARVTAGIRRPLTLVSGAAGAGKTVLVGAWARTASACRDVAWLTAEPGDSAEVFWTYVLEALRRTGTPLPAEVGMPGSGDGVDSSFLIRVAAGLAARADPVVLVVDQCDGPAADGVAEQLHFVLAHADRRLRLVLTCRTDPLMPLHRYRVSGDIAEIRNADLAFTCAEAGELLRGHGLDVSPACVAQVVQRTGAWAAGVRLCALAMQRTHDPEAFVREFDASRTAVADYLLAEVLDAQPQATQDLLIRSCVADRVHPDLVNALTGRSDAGWVLARLSRSNAFVERIDGADRAGDAWYRFHPLFAEVLRAHLRHREPGLEPRLRARTARWLAAAGHVDEAIAQAAAGADWSFAATLVVDNLGIARVATGPQAPAFARMPPELPGPATALVESAYRLEAGDLAGCAAALHRADSRLPAAAGTHLLLGRAVLGMLAARQAGDPAAAEEAARAEELLRRAPQQLRDRRPDVVALVSAGRAAAELAAGHLGDAERRLHAAVAACDRPGTEGPRYDALGCLALVDLLRGRLRDAKSRAATVLAQARRFAGRSSSPAALAHLVLAAVATEHDELKDARPTRRCQGDGTSPSGTYGRGAGRGHRRQDRDRHGRRRTGSRAAARRCGSAACFRAAGLGDRRALPRGVRRAPGERPPRSSSRGAGHDSGQPPRAHRRRGPSAACAGTA